MMPTGKRKSVLIVSSEPLYPARINGISIRYAPIIESLSREIDIDVAVVLRNGESFHEAASLGRYCRDVYCHERSTTSTSSVKKIFVRAIKCIPLGTPHIHHCYDAAEIRLFLKSIAKKRQYDRVIWASSAYLDIGIEVFGASNIVLDSIDSLYNQFARRQPRELLDFFDLIHIKRWELEKIRRTKATIFVSPVDAELYSNAPLARNKVHVIPNGVYLDDFGTSNQTHGEHKMPTAGPSLRLGFLGNMGYQPNIDAALRLKTIFDRVKAIRPEIQLLIIGRAPTDAIRSLDNGNGITVTGTVDNIWAYVEAVDIFVFPMVSGAGQQNKLLEAMIAGKPVITNQLANSGIGGKTNRDLMICDSDDSFVDAIVELANNASRLMEVGRHGQSFIKENFDWNTLLPKLKALYFS